MVTIIWAAPTDFAGLVTEIVVEVLEVTIAFVPPKVTAVGLRRFEPTMVIAVPPVVGPVVGTTWLMLGRAMVIKEPRKPSMNLECRFSGSYVGPSEAYIAHNDRDTWKREGVD